MANAAQQRMTTLRIIWGAMLGSVVMFGVVLFVVRGQGGTGGTPDPILYAMLGIEGLGLAVASVVVPRFMFRKALTSQNIKIKDEPVPGAFGQYREGASTQRVFADPRGAFLRAMTLYNTPFILGCALGEAVALNGFVLGFMGAPLEIAAVFFAVGLLAIGEKHPSIAFVTKQLEAAKDAKMPA